MENAREAIDVDGVSPCGITPYIGQGDIVWAGLGGAVEVLEGAGDVAALEVWVDLDQPDPGLTGEGPVFVLGHWSFTGHG